MTGTYTSPSSQTAGKSGQTAKKSPCGCGENGNSTSKQGDCGCGCHETGTPCCTNVCFERPNYFCGHLLTDDDLTTGVRYVREKNKLYHRTLHGSGIVCGLGVRRDPDCPGNVLIGEGFAIDACGNDLVVCEQQSFNVIAALRRKGCMVTAAGDPCKETDDDDCHMKNCFWIAARYRETPSDFESPLESACSPGPSACEPTRIHETVEFEVLEECPDHPSAIERIAERFKCCFRVLTEGNFAKSVAFYKQDLNLLFSGDDSAPAGTVSDGGDYFDIFCQLRAYFLQHIRKFPDPYDALLEHRVESIPAPPRRTYGDTDRDTKIRATPRESMCGLFTQVFRYVSDCLSSAMVFPCSAPMCGGEVVLGTIEIEDGKLARICHCCRTYVWSAANFWQVLIAYLIQTEICEKPAAPKSDDPATLAGPTAAKTGHCCPEIDFNCDNFFNQYLTDQTAPQEKMLSAIQLLTGFGAATKSALNIFDPNAVSAKLFQGKSQADAQVLAKKFGLNLQISQDAPVQTALSPFENVMAQMSLRPGDTLTATLANNQLIPTLVSSTGMAASATAMQAQVADTQKAVENANAQLQQLSATAAKQQDLQAAAGKIQQLTATAAQAKDLEAANAQIKQLSDAVLERDTTLAGLTDQLTKLAARVALLEKPATPPAQGD
jgi:hypothetical protein